MSPNAKRSVRIHNPAGGFGWTSTKSAIEYIKRGRARYCADGSIEFITSTEHVSCSIRKSVDLTLAGYDRDVSSGAISTERAMIGVPIACPGVALNFGRRKGASRSTFLVTQGF